MDGQRSKILVVDDTPENIAVILDTLRGDYAVIAATDGERGLALARKDPKPDLILLDVMMPGLNGYDVCSLLKKDPETSSIPVIFVTTLSESDDEAKGLDLGAVDYIVKPFIPKLVRSRVHNQIELKRHRDNLEALVRERTKELVLTQEATIDSLGGLAETRDPETGSHIRRTKNYVRVLAETLRVNGSHGISREDVTLLFKSAPLHDIGKVGVPDHILLKPGKLTPEEFEVMKKHTIYGRDAIARAQASLGESSFLHFAAEIAISHHEKWDGTGYPYALAGESIPLSGRIMAVADVYDALISRRVYKPPFSHATARRIIEAGKGKHFDPALVEAFMSQNDAIYAIAEEFADSEEERQALSGPDQAVS